MEGYILQWMDRAKVKGELCDICRSSSHRPGNHTDLLLLLVWFHPGFAGHCCSVLSFTTEGKCGSLTRLQENMTVK